MVQDYFRYYDCHRPLVAGVVCSELWNSQAIHPDTLLNVRYCRDNHSGFHQPSCLYLSWPIRGVITWNTCSFSPLVYSLPGWLSSAIKPWITSVRNSPKPAQPASYLNFVLLVLGQAEADIAAAGRAGEPVTVGGTQGPRVTEPGTDLSPIIRSALLEGFPYVVFSL